MRDYPSAKNGLTRELTMTAPIRNIAASEAVKANGDAVIDAIINHTITPAP